MVKKMNFAQFAASCFDNGAHDNTDKAKTYGTVIRPIAKFALVAFVYFVANVVLSLLFNGSRVNLSIVAELVCKGLHLLVMQTFGMAGALLTDCGLYAVITVAGIVGCGFVFVVKHIVKLAAYRRACAKTSYGKSRCVCGNVYTHAFKHHIQFLS